MSTGEECEVPPREQWPEPTPRTDAGEALTAVILATFRLNGRLMEVAQRRAAEGGLTAAWWQVLGGVLDEPRTVAEIGADELRSALTTMERLIAALEADTAS